MSVPTKSIIESRRDQIFPVLETADIERMRRFGRLRSFRAGEVLARAGQVGDGLTIILAGRVEVSRHDKLANHEPIAIHGPGQFMGELAQLAGRPALIDARASEPGEALIIPPEQLRALLIAEVELGERIMRALILRRVNLLERGVGGPIIVGRADSGDVLRLAGFLRRNGHPHESLDPEADPEAKALVERFHVSTDQLPIVLCPGGQLLRNPSETELARCIGLVGPIDPNRVYDVAVVGAGPAGLATARFTRVQKGSLRWFSTAGHSAARQALLHVSRTISDSQPASLAWRLWGALTHRRRSLASRWRSRMRWSVC